MTGTKPSNGIDLQRAKLELDQYGFTLLPNLLARDAALEMAEKLICLERLREEGEHPYQHLTSLFNHLDSEEYEMFLPLITNPIVLRLAEDTLGGGFQLVGSDVKWTRPDTAASGLHADVPMGWFAEQSLPVPENICFIVQCNWMLTDFTLENGATELLPQSHRFEIPNMWPDEDGNLRFMNDRVRQLRAEIEEGDPNGRLAAAEGSAGSAVVFQGAMWHRAGANVTTDENRVGVLTPYHARWVEPGYGLGLKDSLLRREVREGLPAQVQRMSTHVVEDYPEDGDYPR